MSGLAIIIEEKGLLAAARRLNALGRSGLVPELLDSAGELIADQTRRRLASEKRSPDGKAWRPNRQGTSILFRAGHLAGSIVSQVHGSEVRVGSNLVYAAIHQFGGRITPRDARALHFRVGKKEVFARAVTIPARPWLGLSADNRDDLESVIEDWLEEVLAA